jgi:hypothetical protein
MSDPIGLGLSDLGRQEKEASEPHPRAAGSPLPVGSTPRAPLLPGLDDSNGGPRLRQAPPPGRALANTARVSGDEQTGFQWATNALRMAIPFVQRILPLLDGHVATAVSNLLGSQPAHHEPKVDLTHIEDGLTELHSRHRELRDQVIEQNTSLKRVEDQLEMVREATDRNTLEQQELLEDLKVVSNKVNLFAIVALALLGVSILVNIILYLHIRRVLP